MTNLRSAAPRAKQTVLFGLLVGRSRDREENGETDLFVLNNDSAALDTIRPNVDVGRTFRWFVGHKLLLLFPSRT